jgi:hypothetical protein
VGEEESRGGRCGGDSESEEGGGRGRGGAADGLTLVTVPSVEVRVEGWRGFISDGCRG